MCRGILEYFVYVKDLLKFINCVVYPFQICLLMYIFRNILIKITIMKTYVSFCMYLFVILKTSGRILWYLKRKAERNVKRYFPSCYCYRVLSWLIWWRRILHIIIVFNLSLLKASWQIVVMCDNNLEIADNAFLNLIFSYKIVNCSRKYW